MEVIIRVENTAISNGVAKGAKEYLDCVKKGVAVCDMGAGRLRNSNYLYHNEGFKNMTVIDTAFQIERLRHNINKNFKVYATVDF